MERRAISLLICFLFVPLLGAWLYSALRQPLYIVGRYDTIVLPIFLILLAVGLDTIVSVTPWVGGMFAMALLGLAATSLSTTFDVPFVADQQDIMAAEELAHDAKPSDPIIATGYRELVVAYYLDRAGHHTALMSFPFELGEHPGWMSPERELLDRERLVRDADTLTQRVIAAARQGHTVWILWSGPYPVEDYLFRAMEPHLVLDQAHTNGQSGLMCLKLREHSSG